METEHYYTRESFFKTGWEVFKNVWLKGRRLIVDITLKPDVIPGAPLYYRREKWTDKKPDELQALGYLDAKGLHDSILWWGAKIYCRIHNGKEFPIEEVYPDKKDTAYTLNDALLSDSTKNFKKGLARAQLTATADWQKLFLIGALGVGVIIATKIFGLW